ncbi:gluconokinase [Flavobacterium sp. M31R6]|uniref:gluconokinase n=1 Tax=Flavobacterium sp. M31R6 TaxID=2739062 RepID=UPI001569745E|nr:gluconokinase [Flavobacterium sp. M31R6]QKJ62306.1 gluconokinase [Flavobacterium sp. M31R6]
MEKTYIGIDIGTTATKAICFDANGNVLHQITKEYPMYHPEENWSTQKPNEILDSVLACIKEITKNTKPEFISFSAAMQSILIINKEGSPISDALLWADNRATSIATAIKKSEFGSIFYQKTGIPIHPFSPMTKLAWLKENEPNLFNNAFKFISLKEYIWHQLTGEYVIDSSMASGTGIMNIHTLQWDETILNYLNIKENQLSKIVSPTHKSKGIKDDFLYILGGGDGPLANLGTGSMEKNRIALSIGTSGAVRIPIEQPYIDAEMRTQCYHLMNNQYLKLGAVNNGAIILQWLKESLLKTNESYETLLEQAKQIPAGSDGLLFVPYLLGERAPIWDAEAQGTLLGIKITHHKVHFIRATLEGILFGLFSVVEILLPDSKIRKETTVMVSGGFGKSELWLQMVADIFQMNVVVSETIEGAAWGAVLIGFKATGNTKSLENKIETIFYPNPNHRLIYEKAFEKFKKVYPLLKDI